MMLDIRHALIKLTREDSSLRPHLVPVTHLGSKWQSLPDGWDASSRQKFWETLTGDNKHKVTKCIKEMSKGDKGIDDPGAFCASLADRVLGKGWRKKSSNEQTPNKVDTGAARLKDYLEGKVNEQYRKAHPATIPPTLTLLHGNDFIRVIRADGGLHREALAFVSRVSGNVYPAAGWGQPKPYVVANVLDTHTWEPLWNEGLYPQMASPVLGKTAKAEVTPVRQRTQYSCMAASMAMCLRALGHEVTEDEVNRVMGARPMQGAAWEQALACAQHYGCRATLTMPCTVEQLKKWTDQGIPVMIAWNPEGRPWSHASVVFDVDDDMNVYVADPNIPNPKKTVRVVTEDEFYSKWSEKFPDYLVRRPACAIEREITVAGENVRMASAKTARIPWAPLPGGGHKYVTPELVVHIVSETETYTVRDRQVPSLHEIADHEMLADGVPELVDAFDDAARHHALWVRQGWWPRPATRQAWKVYIIHRPSRKHFESAFFAKKGEALKKAEEAIPKILNRKRPRWLTPVTASETDMSIKTSEEYDRKRDDALTRGRGRHSPSRYTPGDAYAHTKVVKSKTIRPEVQGFKTVIDGKETQGGHVYLMLQFVGGRNSPLFQAAQSSLGSRKGAQVFQDKIRLDFYTPNASHGQPGFPSARGLQDAFKKALDLLENAPLPAGARVAASRETPLQQAVWTAWDHFQGAENVQEWNSFLGAVTTAFDMISVVSWVEALRENRGKEDRVLMQSEKIQEDADKWSRRMSRIERQSRSWRTAYNMWLEGRIDIDKSRLARDMDKTLQSVVKAREGLNKLMARVREISSSVHSELKHDRDKAMSSIKETHDALQKAIGMAKAGKMAKGKKPQKAPKTQDERKKEQGKIQGEAPKKRDEAARALAERGGTGAGRHKNKAQRGQGTKGKGKAQRHPKHRGQARLAVERVSARFMESAYSGNPDGKPIYDVDVDHGENQALSGGHDVMKRLQDRYLIEQGKEPREKNPRLARRRLDQGLRRQVNEAFVKQGLGGRGRYSKPSQGYAVAVGVMQDFGIELDEVVSSHLFGARPRGVINADIAFSNEADPFSPESISNSVLHLQFTELEPNRFEVIAYLS